jgi:hypothetical protein
MIFNFRDFYIWGVSRCLGSYLGQFWLTIIHVKFAHFIGMNVLQQSFQIYSLFKESPVRFLQNTPRDMLTVFFFIHPCLTSSFRTIQSIAQQNKNNFHLKKIPIIFYWKIDLSPNRPSGQRHHENRMRFQLNSDFFVEFFWFKLQCKNRIKITL